MTIAKGRSALHRAMRLVALQGGQIENIEPLVVEAARSHIVLATNVIGLYAVWWRTVRWVSKPTFSSTKEAWEYHARGCNKLRAMIAKGKLLRQQIYAPVTIVMATGPRPLVEANPKMRHGMIELVVSQEFGRVPPEIASAAVSKAVDHVLTINNKLKVLPTG